jgi:hypothetical protein
MNPAVFQKSTCVPDLEGAHYQTCLEALHRSLHPSAYLEIGTLNGETLALARCPSIAIDPQFDFFQPLVAQIIAKPCLFLFRMTSDDFFAEQDPVSLLGSGIDLAFLDGLHHCEVLLRDFMHVERYCKENSVIVLHDCLPVEEAIAERERTFDGRVLPHRNGWWTGDVWRTALLLKRYRPDLSIAAFDAAPSGLVLITGLAPQSRILADHYAAHVERMSSWHLRDLGIDGLFEELGVEPAASLSDTEQMRARFLR